jgi:phosphate transport system permease protein
LFERLFEILLFCCALTSLLLVVALVAVLAWESFFFFREIQVTRFLLDLEWTPLFAEKRYGILLLLLGTLQVTVVAMVVALPPGLLIAVYLNEYAPSQLRRIVKPLLEVLAGIPTVVYGYFALLAVTPVLQKIFPQIARFNALSPGIVLGLMIIRS